MKKFLGTILILVFLLNGCVTQKQPYHFEVFNNAAHVKICCTVINTQEGKVVLSGRLSLASKFYSVPHGKITITIYSPSGELLLVKNANYHAPMHRREWLAAGVYFESELDMTPPTNSRIEVTFNTTDNPV